MFSLAPGRALGCAEGVWCLNQLRFLHALSHANALSGGAPQRAALLGPRSGRRGGCDQARRGRVPVEGRGRHHRHQGHQCSSAKATRTQKLHGKLLGARIAVFNELEPGEKLKTSEVQLLSGGDGVPATPKYRDPMTIEPRHRSMERHGALCDHDPEPSRLDSIIIRLPAP